MKKKNKGMTIKEIDKICKKYNKGNYVNCPLYFDSELRQ